MTGAGPSNIDSLAKYGFRTLGKGHAALENTPDHWASYSHYTVWEAEGFPGTFKNLVYDQGRVVDDFEASEGDLNGDVGD